MIDHPDNSSEAVFKNLVSMDPSKVSDPDHRVFLDYWDNLRGDRLAPPWSEWDWSKIPANLIPYCFVVNVLDNGHDFRYRFWGTAHTKIHGVDYTGRKTSDILPKDVADIARAQYEQAFRNQKPVIYLHELRVGSYQSPRIQTSLRLPLSSDGQNIDQLFSFADWREIQEDMKKFFETVHN